MSIKQVIVITILSTAITILFPLFAIVLGLWNLSGGIPFKWTGGAFLAPYTDYTALLLDILFWFIVIWIAWKVISSSLDRGGRVRRK